MTTNISSPGGVLCDECRRLFEKITSGEYGTIDPLHTDGVTLQRSLDSGCAICTRLPWDLATFKHDEVNVERIMRTELTFTCYATNGARQEFVLWVFEVSESEPLLQLCQKAAAQDSSGSGDSLKMAAEWLLQCVNTHTGCRPNQSPERYPSRLLDIQSKRVRLVETRQSHITGPYATLSHSWGGTTFEMLTSDTLPMFRNGIHLEHVPATFRDAIVVARSLNIPYLWIDCYCIMQSGGRSDEKQEEISRMGDIYSNAMVNIGAAAAQSPMDGCFASREPRQPVRIDFKSEVTGEETSLLINKKDQVSIDWNSLYLQARSSTFTRAWCMQERFLCPRMLHFSASGIFWECQALPYASEFLPVYHLSINTIPFALKEEYDDRDSLDKKELRLIRLALRTDEWCRIVNMYSAMDLSYPQQDKLAACGGVAKVMASILQDDYIAGFFRKSCILTLAWVRAAHDGHQHHNILATRRAPFWRAPSWSWASMDGGVTMERNNGAMFYKGAVPQMQILSFDYELVDPNNPYGALKSAKLTAKGLVTEVSLHFDGMFGSERVCAVAKRGREEIRVILDDPREQPLENVIILITTSRDDHITLGHSASGLLLVASENKLLNETQSYRRVGAFWETTLTGGPSQDADKNGILATLTQRVIEIV